MYNRILDVHSLSLKKSFFLFGPRSTGKTTLLRSLFSEDAIINLLVSSTYIPLAASPSRLADMIRERSKKNQVIVIDEIQKLPALLDEIHNLIETTNIHFILTGSSARKLKRSGVNLLAGRAWQANLFPLVYPEITDFNLDRYLLYGGLPQVYASDYPDEELDAYVRTYLQEEIQAEALVQNLPQFSRFLKTAAVSNTEQINFSNIASNSGIPASTVRSYFDILSDTFTGFLLESWQASEKRKAVATAKFYFFDTGVANFLCGRTSLEPSSAEYGKAFEHFIALELRAWISYRRNRLELRYWRTKSGTEVDFLVGEEIAIEVKAAHTISDKHLKGLRALAEERIIATYILVSFDTENRETEDGIRCLHWSTFLEELWSGALRDEKETH
ncbi:MAG TPA: ATP-binding protein [Treponemataceae bacterium]|nr:ATP-binding protein [Treponemataceae bacterium]